MAASRILVVAWLLTIAGTVAVWVGVPDAESKPVEGVMLILLPPFAAVMLALLAVIYTAPAAPLRRTLVYRGTLSLLVASSAATLAAAGSTVFVDHTLFGFAMLASTNLLVMIAGWRALVRPAPRRAAIVGLLAVALELASAFFDLIVNFARPNPELSDQQISLLFVAALATTGCGALVSIAALVSFDRSTSTHVPAARIASAAG
jgi:hypothetical protein